MRRVIYTETLRLFGEEHRESLIEANNYADCLQRLRRFEEVKTLLRKTIPVARRVVGERHIITLTLRKIYAETLYLNPAATLDDIREAVATLEELEPTSRRLLGGAHPKTVAIQGSLRNARVMLRL